MKNENEKNLMSVYGYLHRNNLTFQENVIFLE